MKYVPALDGIRALAILFVVLFHARTREFGLQGGFLGVDVFFVLSGYLITGLLADEHARSGTIRLGHFYLKRARRLYPALLLMLGGYLWLAPKFFPMIPLHKNIRDVVVSALYLSDYAAAFYRIPLRIGHTWSLAIEEHFYLVWPLALLFLLKLKRSTAIACIFGLFVAATAWRWWSLELFHRWAFTYVRFDARLSGLLLGSAVGLWQPQLRGRAGFALCGLAGLAVLVTTQTLGARFGLRYGVLFSEICSVALLLGATSIPIFRWPIMVWIGRMSYGWYLWHYPILRGIHKFGIHDFWQRLLIGGGVSLLLAAVSYYTVERLFRVQRDKPPVLARTPASAP